MDEIYLKLKFSESVQWDIWTGCCFIVRYLCSDLVALLRRLLGYNMKKTCKLWRFANVIWQALSRILSVVQLRTNLFVGWAVL